MGMWRYQNLVVVSEEEAKHGLEHVPDFAQKLNVNEAKDITKSGCNDESSADWDRNTKNGCIYTAGEIQVTQSGVVAGVLITGVALIFVLVERSRCKCWGKKKENAEA
jgi:hypothetical protein